MRRSYDLNEDWLFAKTDQIPEHMPEAGGIWEAVTLPHTWNAQDGQDGGNDYYRGTGIYVRKLEPLKLPGVSYPYGELQYGRKQRIVLEFPAAAMTAAVYVDGKRLAYHEGGYSAFRVDITEELQKKTHKVKRFPQKKWKGEFLLCVVVDNSANDRIYPQKADFTFYGGLYRGVKLLYVPQLHFERYLEPGGEVKIVPLIEEGETFLLVESWQPANVWVSYYVMDNKEIYPDLEIVEVSGAPPEEIQAECDEISCDIKSTSTYVRAKLRMPNAHLWNGVEDPYMYQFRAELFTGPYADEYTRVPFSEKLVWGYYFTEDDSVKIPFGFRTFSMDPEKGFFLNGKPYPLRGVSRHQDRLGVGNALTPDMHQEDMELIREMGANTIRLAHYQQAQEFYDLADKYGMIVWAEIPYITQHMPNGRENTLSQMRELVTQCYHHPSIVCWGLSNEITASGAVTEDMLENHRLLNELCHRLDPTRPTTMAHVFMLETDSPITEIPDISSYNLYFGWYLGELQQNDQFFDEYHAKFPERCIGFSEYGADANPQFQTAVPEVGDYTEQYQACYHEHILQCIEKRPYLWATHVWNMFDFAADGRDEGGAHGLNQKGLVTFDRKTKKDAFYLYQAYWSKEPMVHICGRRYVDRTEEVTEVKVYSNQPEVTLWVDGKLFATQKAGEQAPHAAHIFRFQVPICGEHIIRAEAELSEGEEPLTAGRQPEQKSQASNKVPPENGTSEGDRVVCQDEIQIRHVTEANPAYCFQKEAIVNWFDREELDPSCYSIRDTMGELMANPEAAALLEGVMAKATASRGDVAESTRGNVNLQKMMAAMPMEKLLKQVGEAVTPEEVREFNRKLQEIHKH